MWHIVEEVLLNAILVTGLVIVMMMLIECFNVWSKGRFVGAFKGRGLGQIVVAALLGATPGCMGGFAAVSMYTHGMLSFGALVAMMIASSGDESFVMLAMIPEKAWWVFLALTVLAILAGLIVDAIRKPKTVVPSCRENYTVHADEEEHHSERHFSWKRVAIFLGVAAFLAALGLGMLEHEHEEAVAIEAVEDIGTQGMVGEAGVHELTLGGINLLSEDWMNVMFACFGLIVLVVVIAASDHFVNEHLWHHIIREHLPRIFAWTFGALAVIAVLLHFVDMTAWVNDNVVLMIILAALVGIIPESGPHLLFVTMYASGIAPLPVLIASCISQDGHAALPLLAESRKTFFAAKAINFLVAVLAGLMLVWLG